MEYTEKGTNQAFTACIRPFESLQPINGYSLQFYTCKRSVCYLRVCICLRNFIRFQSCNFYTIASPCLGQMRAACLASADGVCLHSFTLLSVSRRSLASASAF